MLRIGSNYFDRKFPSSILNLDSLKKLYILHNPGISVNISSSIGNITGLMDLELSFTSLHNNIPSEFVLLNNLCYLVMDENHIHCPIPTKLYNIQQIKCLSIEFVQPTIQLYGFPYTSAVVVCFTHILLFMLRVLTKYLLSYQLYFSCTIPSMSPI